MMPRRRTDRSGRLILREQLRRRALWLGILAIAVLALSPLFTHHLIPFGDGATADRSHLVALCLIALQTLVGPVHELFHLLFFAGLAYALYDRVRAWKLAREGLALIEVEAVTAEDRVWRAAAAAGVDPARIRVAHGLPGAALTVGLWRPLIFVARETVDRLTPKQLASVLVHEATHLRRRDPLRLSLLRFLSCALFWVPALRSIADDVADEAEIIADDHAAAEDPLVLASALVEVAKFATQPLPRVAVGFHSRPLLERRIRRLIGEQTEPSSHLTRQSAVGAAVVLFLVLGSGAVMAHPSGPSAAAQPVHCTDHDVPVVNHLFCLADRVEHSAEDCPHQVYSEPAR